MNSFRQHIPAFVDVDQPPATIPFETTADLLALEVVQRYTASPTFSYFALSGHHLMAISDNGYHWWVVGSIEQPAAVDLPQWAGWKFFARLPDGREVTLTDDVISSCGGRLSLRDGRVVVDVLYERQMAKQAADRVLEDRGICSKCVVAKVTTRADDGPMTRVEETCPRCGGRRTSWEPK